MSDETSINGELFFCAKFQNFLKFVIARNNSAFARELRNRRTLKKRIVFEC